SPADPEPPPTTPSDDDPERGPEAPPEPSTTPSSESAAKFGSQRPTRFAADVEYRGRVEGHDYLVRVRHRFLDSSFTVAIDGVEHDPKAEEKAAKKAEKVKEAEDGGETGRAGTTGAEAEAGTDPGDLDPGDGDP